MLYEKIWPTWVEAKTGENSVESVVMFIGMLLGTIEGNFVVRQEAARFNAVDIVAK